MPQNIIISSKMCPWLQLGWTFGLGYLPHGFFLFFFAGILLSHAPSSRDCPPSRRWRWIDTYLSWSIVQSLTPMAESAINSCMIIQWYSVIIQCNTWVLTLFYKGSFPNQKSVASFPWRIQLESAPLILTPRHSSSQAIMFGVCSCLGPQEVDNLVTQLPHFLLCCHRKIWVFPKIMGKPPKSSMLIGFSIIFTIHFGVPVFLGTPIW